MHGATARAEHAAVRLGTQQAAEAAAAGAADLSAGGRRAGHRRSRAQSAARTLGRRLDLEGDHRKHDRAGLARYSAGAQGKSYARAPLRESAYVETRMPARLYQTNWCAQKASDFIEANADLDSLWLFSENGRAHV